jgi:hypothetical protein
LAIACVYPIVAGHLLKASPVACDEPELDKSLTRFHAPIVGDEDGEEAARAIQSLSGKSHPPLEYLDPATVIKVPRAVSGEIARETHRGIPMRTAIEP